MSAEAHFHLHCTTGYLWKFPKATAPSQLENSYQEDWKKTSTGEKNRGLGDKRDGHNLLNGEAPLTALYSPSGVYVFPAVYQHCGLGEYSIHCIRKYT